jgi:hypothetical protein
VRTRWETLYETFDDNVRHAGDRAFAKLAVQPACAAFADLRQLYDFLVEDGGDLDARDRVLAALVAGARRDDTRGLATALLWLALWPGLCGVYRRRQRWGAHADDVVSAIGFAFTALVGEMDLTRVHRVAATLVRSTERDVVGSLRPRTNEVALVDGVADGLAAMGWDLEHELRVARGWLVRIVGRHAELVLAVAVLGETQSEAAARVGITPVAARKRYRRAIAQAREAWALEAVA